MTQSAKIKKLHNRNYIDKYLLKKGKKKGQKTHLSSVLIAIRVKDKIVLATHLTSSSLTR